MSGAPVRASPGRGPGAIWVARRLRPRARRALGAVRPGHGKPGAGTGMRREPQTNRPDYRRLLLRSLAGPRERAKAKLSERLFYQRETAQMTPLSRKAPISASPSPI